MKFRTGGYFKHTGGQMMHVLAQLSTTNYGNCYIAETQCGDFKPVGKDETSATNWESISASEWDEHFARLNTPTTREE